LADFKGNNRRLTKFFPKEVPKIIKKGENNPPKDLPPFGFPSLIKGKRKIEGFLWKEGITGIMPKLPPSEIKDRKLERGQGS